MESSAGRFPAAELFSFGLPGTAYFAGAAGLAVVVAGVVGFFTLECLTFFTGFLDATAGVEGVAGFAGVVAAGGFWAANIEVAAMARVNRVVFMVFVSPFSASLFRSPSQLYGVSPAENTR